MEIISNCGQVILVDADDYPILIRFNWNIHPNGYARTTIQDKCVFMHHLILGTNPGAYVADHINKTPLDNRKCNLRWATKQGNSANSRPRGPYGFKGVRKQRSGTKYCAYITVDGKQQHLGSFNTADRAAEAYNKAAIKAFGQYASLNKIQG